MRAVGKTPTVSTRVPKRWRWRFALFGASILLAVLLAEVSVRVLHLGPTVYIPRRFEPAGGVPFTTLIGDTPIYQPNTTFSSVYDPAGDLRGYFGADGRVAYHINRFGMRGPEVPLAKEAGTFRIVCLGDSVTFGEGVHDADTYPARLADLLARSDGARRVDVVNMGVQAYGTKEAVALYLLRGRQFHPDVVTLGFVLNDATDFAETIRQNEAHTKDITLSPIGRVSRLWGTFERNRLARRMQSEFFETTRRSFQSEKWNECRDLIDGMAQLSREDRFRFVVVIFPILWGLDRDYPFEDLHALVADACHRAGCEVVDLMDVYGGCQASSLWVHPTDHHPNELAHRLAAERVAQFLTAKQH